MAKQIYSQCVAGYGHPHSLWFEFSDDRLVGCFAVTPDEQLPERLAVDWLVPRILVFKTPRKNGPPHDLVLPYLTKIAATRSIQAALDCHIHELAVGLAYQYSWQLINGAKILPDYGELAKLYVGPYALYVFKTEGIKEAVGRQLGDP